MKSILTNFSGGIVQDSRDTSQGVCRVVTNFDINTSPNRLIPYRSSEDGDSAGSTSKKQNFCIAYNGSAYALYALGVQSGTAKAEVMYKLLSTSVSNDLDDNTWGITSNYFGGNYTTLFNPFIYYPKTAFIYGAQSSGGTTYIWRYDPTGSVAWVDTHQSLGTVTNMAQGIVHSKDDILYIPYDNKIAKNDNGSWTVAALTLPSQYYITSICEFNNYIAIMAAPSDNVGSSRVFIWDRSTTLATITESIDWGSGVGKIIEEVDGYLVGITLDGNSTVRFNSRVVFKYYTGAGAKQFTELLGTTGVVVPLIKQKINNRLYFMMSISLNGSTRDGVWSFGKNPNGQGFNLAHERTPNNDTSIGSGPVRAFIYVGDFLFQAYVNSSAANAVSKTDDGATYSASSTFETVINPNMPTEDKIKQKQLEAISIGYRSSASGQVVVKYRVDSTSSYTTVCTCTTTGLNVLEFIDAGGVPFTSGREYEFQIISSLGAEVIEFGYKYSIIPTLS